MFEEVLGIPAHPLLLHVPVVFVPLLALLTVAYAFLPFVRPHTRWVAALLAVATPISALVTTLSGDALFARLESRDRISPEYYPRLEAHEDFGELTLYSSIVLGVLTLALVFLVAPRRAGANADGRDGGPDGRGGGRRVLSVVLGALAVVAAGVSLYYVIRTGDSGAHAVWDGS